MAKICLWYIWGGGVKFFQNGNLGETSAFLFLPLLENWAL